MSLLLLISPSFLTRYILLISTNCSAYVLIKNNKVVTSVVLNVNQPFLCGKTLYMYYGYIYLYKYKVFVL
jgi:hypothetical protein